MIPGLLLSAAGLAVLLWLTLMFMWWRQEQGTSEQLATTAALAYSQKSIRLGRRGWYHLAMRAKTLGALLNRLAARIFFTLFPSAQPAFAKRDALAGLSQGPSSFFLMSISQEQKVPKKKSPKRIV